MNRLNVIGFGVKGTRHLTVEARGRLREADHVLYIGHPDVDFGTVTTAPVESLVPLYRDGEVAQDNHARLLARVRSAVAEHREVVLLVPGHPRFGVALVRTFEACSARGEFELKIILGLSSFDTIIEDVGIDPLERGTQVVDANRLLLFEHRLNPEFNTVIYHVSSAGTPRTHFLDPSRENRLGLLRDLLLRAYGPEHPVSLVQSAILPEESAAIASGTVGRLEQLMPQLSFASTLFLPAIRPRRINREVLAFLDPRSADTRASS